MAGNNLPFDFTPSKAVAVTPSDSTDLDIGVLFVGTGGDVKVDLATYGTSVTYKHVADGVFLPVLVKRVYSTGTTASDIVIHQ